MPLSRQEEMADRLDYIEEEKRKRASTFSQFAQAEAGEARGRFTSHETASVIGASAKLPEYAAPNWAPDPCGIEKPLGYSIEDHEPVGQPHELKRSIADDASHLGPSTHSAKATSSVVPLAEPGDPTAVLPPAQSGRRLFSRMYRRA